MSYPLGLGYGQSAPTPSGTEHGQDIETPYGTNFTAPVAGTVHIHRDDTLGLYLTLSSGANTYYFGHLSGVTVQDGQQINAGSLLGATGGPRNGVVDPSTYGDATGPHLWFAVQQNGSFVDPMKYLNQQAMFGAAGAGAPKFTVEAGQSVAGSSAATTTSTQPADIPTDVPLQQGFDEPIDIAKSVSGVLGLNPSQGVHVSRVMELAQQRLKPLLQNPTQSLEPQMPQEPQAIGQN